VALSPTAAAGIATLGTSVGDDFHLADWLADSMFEFIRRKFGGDGGDDGDHGTQGLIADLSGMATIVNLTRAWWVAECGDSARHVVRSAAGREIFDDGEHIQELQSAFLRMGSESREIKALEHVLSARKPLLVVYPPRARLRNETMGAFEEFLRRRLKVSSSDFDIIKLYHGAVRPGGEKFCRKFRGQAGPQVVLNLSGEGVWYLHFDVEARDVVIDALDPDWPSVPTGERLERLVEGRLRGMDPAYFGRIRDGIESGLLLVYLPEPENHRGPVLGKAGWLLAKAPGGAIDLNGDGVIRWYRSSRAAEQSRA
jgi:hypothetical protein